MSRTLRGGIAGATTVAVLLLIMFLSLGSSPQGQSGGKTEAPPKRVRPPGKPIPMAANLIGLEINLGIKDKQRTPWDGDIQLSEGKIQTVEIQRGSPDAKVDGNRFSVHSIRRMMMMQEVIIHPVLRVVLEGPVSAKVTVNTRQGKFDFAVSELAAGSAKEFLDGQASVERQEAPVRLTGKETEDDYPALAKAANEIIYLAYVEYQPGKPIVPERLNAGEFDTLVASGHGDQIRLMRFNGKVWEPPIDVTDAGLDVWRPAITVDGNGVVWVAWSQQVDGDWEIFYRRYTPPELIAPPAPPAQVKGLWHDIVRVTRSPGSDFHVVATTDANGTVWLAWQGWRQDNYEILLAAMDDKHPWKEPRVISNSKANDWSPAIAADKQGNVYVAWDTYDKGNYDVRLFKVGKESKIIEVANSPKFEARPSISCDAANRLWIAYEEGEEQWGKDYSTDQFRKIPFDKNPGAALYTTRTVRVKCLVDDKLMQPAGDIEAAFQGKLSRNKSVPRLTVDDTGGVWMMLRHHPLPNGAGEVWNSYALRYQGKNWSAPQRMPESANLLDNRPAMVPHGAGILTVYSGDNRVRSQDRDQNDLFAALLTSPGKASAPELIPDRPAGADAAKAAVEAVHPNETADVARIRDYRIEAGGKKLRLFRGEFHRHTEYTAHRDQDGLLEDSWRYALDAGNMDWMGNADHDNGFNIEYAWWTIQKITDIHHNPPRFVAAQTYERSVVYPNGHRNVMMPRRGIRPLPRGGLPGTPETGAPDTKRLYAYLKHFGGICSSHTSATSMGTDWRDNNPEVEPVVEIYQGHRHNYEHFGAPRAPTKETNIGGYEPAGYVWNALEKGYRLGFQSSSDHVSTHMSYGMVLLEEPSRQALIDAFKKRHSYAATDNIILDVHSGNHLLGDEFETDKWPTLDVHVIGTAPIAKVHVIRDNKYVYSSEPREKEVKLQYSDMDAKEGKTSFYYVRVEQVDGNLAWGSPMWIKYKVK